MMPENSISECFARNLQEGCQSDEIELRVSMKADLCQLRYKPPDNTDICGDPSAGVYESESL